MCTVRCTKIHLCTWCTVWTKKRRVRDVRISTADGEYENDTWF